MYIVGSEAVPEAEWWAMLPANVSVHAARITAPAPWATWQEDQVSVDLADDLARGTRQFASMRLSAVVVGHSSSSFVGGKGWDEAVVDNIHDTLNSHATHEPNAIVTTNGLDTMAALRASGVQRPFLILPSWFNEKTVQLGVRYYEAHGFEPAGYLRHDPGPKWRDLPPENLYPHGLGFEQEIEPLHDQIKANCPNEADGILIAGTGFRCIAILNALEQKLKRPVISANQASLWHCLRLTGIGDNIPGYGNLFRL
jgi:maleate isomerase